MERSDRHFLLIDIFLTSNTHINLFDRTALGVGYRLSEEWLLVIGCQLSVKRCSLLPNP